MGSFRDPSPVNVMIVDDSDLVCTVIQRLLSADANIAVVHCASSAKDAQSYLTTQVVDVVTLDLNLPDANGIPLVEEMLSLGCPAVIAVSASPEQCRLACEHGAIAAFDKLKLFDERFSFISTIHRAADISRARRLQPESVKSKFAATSLNVTTAGGVSGVSDDLGGYSGDHREDGGQAGSRLPF